MLAFADAGAVLLVSLFFLAVGYDWHLVLWSAALLPMWILLAKLMGLYDNDHRALRHLTADEFGQLFTWAVRGTVIACPRPLLGAGSLDHRCESARNGGDRPGGCILASALWAVISGVAASRRSGR